MFVQWLVVLFSPFHGLCCVFDCPAAFGMAWQLITSSFRSNSLRSSRFARLTAFAPCNESHRKISERSEPSEARSAKLIRVKIDRQMRHWNDPHEGGTKYSIVLFRSDKKPKSNVMNEARLRKMAKEKAEKAEMVSESSA